MDRSIELKSLATFESGVVRHSEWKYSYIYRMSFSSIAYVRLAQGVTCVGCFITVKRIYLIYYI